MPVDTNAAFGIFSDRLSTENAIETLRSAGFRHVDIFALFPDELPTKKVSRQTPRKAVFAAVAGAAVALATGALLEWLVGAAMVSAGGLGALLFMGVGGGLIGAWLGRCTPDYEARYEGRVRRGDILVSVHCVDLQWARKAKEILKRSGGDDVSSTSRVTADLGIAHQVVFRPVGERTVAPPLRLVTNRNSERPGLSLSVSREPDQPEVHRKSAAS
jgi:hypothetical protein